MDAMNLGNPAECAVAPEEEWREIESWPDYRVSNLGRIKSFRAWGIGYRPPRILKPWFAGGYPAITLYGDGGRQSKQTVHHLVCTAFHGTRPSPSHEVAHGDGNPENCRSDNLRWATGVENNADKREHGTHGIKLSEEDVLEIRRLCSNGICDQKISDEYKISNDMVLKIRMGSTWKWLIGDFLPIGRATDKSKPRRGENHPRSKLNEVQVREIRASKGQPHADIAVRYGISKITVSQIICRRIWKHVE